jgi:hypothetical protein
VGLETDADRTKYIDISRYQIAGRSLNIKIGNNSTESLERFKYLGTTLTTQNSIHEEIKGTLKLGNACYHLVQNLLSSILLYKNIKITINGTIILSLVLCRCEIWSVTLSEEYKPRLFENRVLRRIFEPKTDKVTGV